ncbi:fatty acid desaturase [Salibacterium qingdaonense]|uniref:Omega-6 fatty acid desaturase (Delta-12 desaturase) n=1 Tax=Salibacterium qingdaonense TaxID=266892 RepID=A0A1I4PWG5_9BACI|nr:fatty acid desaturase [Salibacterium qingdaonense]SFM32172.1 omega-6 fatty acid desaturase (delta-12 desaturase) [Salibacterium qingdaonense]
MSKQQQKELKKSVTPFAQPNIKASIIQIINSILPFFLIWFLAYQSIAVSLWLTIPLTIAAALFAVRIFIIFHDCAHDSFFENKKTNRIVGTITGIITHFAFAKWKKTHAMHHATSGNLDRRGTGDIWMMTVDEYTAASTWKKIKYRLYRNPFVMFGLGPFFLFLLDNRFNENTAKKSEKRNTYLINGSIAAIYTLLIWIIGWQAFLIVQLPILYVSGALGIWLFYVQHQFEDSYFENEEEWNFVKAAVDGSSYYKLPKMIQWLSGNIGFHHVHHLSPRVPNYNLEKTHEQVTPLQQATTITLGSSLQSIRFRLYDEDNKRFVNFREMKYLLKQEKHQYN